MDWGLPDFSVHGIFLARILEWVAIPYSRGSSQPKDETLILALVGGFLTPVPLGKALVAYKKNPNYVIVLEVKNLRSVSLAKVEALSGLHSFWKL